MDNVTKWPATGTAAAQNELDFSSLRHISTLYFQDRSSSTKSDIPLPCGMVENGTPTWPPAPSRLFQFALLRAEPLPPGCMSETSNPH